jgi:hypothetical protein
MITTKYAAGIIPYIKKNDGEIHILLGYENNKWSGFVGKYEDSDKENIINTAIREFTEETLNIFSDYTDLLKNKIIHSDSILVTTRTRNREVYIYFVKFDEFFIDIPFETIFLKTLNLNKYVEKTKIKWIHYRELHKYQLLYNLEKIILDNIKNF